MKKKPRTNLATILTKKFLYQTYVLERKSGPEIALLVGCSSSSVDKYLKKHNIETRSISESKRGKPLSKQHKESISKALKNKMVGEANPFFGRHHTEKTKQSISKANKGNRWKHSEEAKRKIGETHRGKKLSKPTKKKIAQARQGKKLSEETKKKISKASSGKNNPMWRKPRPDMIGPNNPSWKGGITPLIKLIRTSGLYITWRQEVYRRDNFTCQWCGDQTSGNLNADHIVPLSFLVQQYSISSLEEANECVELWDTNNGRTLCVECHKKTKTWGYKATNFTKEDYEK